MVLMPSGTFPNAKKFFLLNLTQRQFLRLSYGNGTAAKDRIGGTAEIVPLNGGPAQPLPEGFVATHEWGLRFDEGGTILADEANHRWPVTGTTESAERPPMNHPEAESSFRQSVPNYRLTVIQQRWTLGGRISRCRSKRECAVHFQRWQTRPGAGGSSARGRNASRVSRSTAPSRDRLADGMDLD